MSRAAWMGLAAAALLLASPVWGQISVVNMIPQTESNEEHQDSEQPHESDRLQAGVSSLESPG